MTRIARAALVLLAAALVAGCASTVHTRPADAVGLERELLESGRSWWHVRIHLAREPGAAPAWHLDALLADQVFAPVLDAQERHLSLWRFHRRAVDDAAGHRFSFTVYADPATAADIRRRVEASALLARLRDAGLVERVTLPDPSRPRQLEIRSTSDRSWPPAVQRAWPWFAMGASRHWLVLIEEVRRELGPIPARASVDALVARYRGVDDRVTAIWREHGQHAHLHHLNAIFGYRPLVIRSTTLERF